MDLRGVSRSCRVLALAGLALAWSEGNGRAETAVARGTLWLESEGRSLEVDMFRPVGPGPHPAVVVLHGGGTYTPGEAMLLFGEALSGQGFVVLMPHYMRSFHSNWVHWQVTARNAVTLAQGLPYVDPDRIGMSGLSMGGQVALSAAARDDRVKAVAEFFTAWPGSLPDEPIGKLPPVLLLNGTADPIIPTDDALVLAEILARRGMPHYQHLYYGHGHGFGTGGPVFEDGVLRTAVFFGAHIGGPSNPQTPPVGTISPADLTFFDDFADEDTFTTILTRKARLANRSVKRRRKAPRPLTVVETGTGLATVNEARATPSPATASPPERERRPNPFPSTDRSR